MIFNFLSFGIKCESDPIENILFAALQELVEIGGARARCGIVIILSTYYQCEKVPEIKDATALLLCYMDFPIELREPTATELLTRVIEYIEKNKPDAAATTDKTSK